MNKPSWKDAPEWANYLAMNQYGEWGWYKNKPLRIPDKWIDKRPDLPPRTPTHSEDGPT